MTSNTLYAVVVNEQTTINTAIRKDLLVNTLLRTHARMQTPNKCSNVHLDLPTKNTHIRNIPDTYDEWRVGEKLQNFWTWNSLNTGRITRDFTLINKLLLHKGISRHTCLFACFKHFKKDYFPSLHNSHCTLITLQQFAPIIPFLRQVKETWKQNPKA